MALTALLDKLGKLIKEVLNLVRDTERNRTDVRELQEQLYATKEDVRFLAYELSRINERMAHEINRINERETDEREKTELRMKAFKLEVEQQILRARLKESSLHEGKDE